MHLLDLTLDEPVANLALDEALLDEAEADEHPRETLRLWEPLTPFVVIGRSSQPNVEVRLERCRERGVPVYRRTSGGAAIVTGPGCLMYAVLLSLERRPALRMVDEAHRFVLGTMVPALRRFAPGVTLLGTSDLVFESDTAPAESPLRNGTHARKFSGNSLRIKRRHLLYHGTLLYNFPLELVADCLGTPPRQPQYRAGRPHRDFIANLPAPAESLRHALATAWSANVVRTDWPQSRVQVLLSERYSKPEWAIEV